MTANNHTLELHLHFVDGREQHFIADEPEEIEKILKATQPNRLFLQKHQAIAGSYFTAGFSAEKLTRISLVAHELPKFSFPGGITEIIQIAPEMLDKRAIPRRSDPERSEMMLDPGAEVETFAEIFLADGFRLCVRITAHAQGTADQRSQLTQLFGGAGFHVTRRGKGITIVNSHQITGWTLFPGPAKAPMTSWRAHRVDPRDQGEAPSVLIKKMQLEEKEEDDIPEKIVVGGSEKTDAPPPQNSDSPDDETIAEKRPQKDQGPTDLRFAETKKTEDLRETGELKKPKRRILKFGQKKDG